PGIRARTGSRSLRNPRPGQAMACACWCATMVAVAPSTAAGTMAWTTCAGARKASARRWRWTAGPAARPWPWTCRCRWCRGTRPCRRPTRPRRPPPKRSERDQLPGQGLEHRLAAAVDLELAVDALDVVRHRVARDPQVVGDLVVGEALGDAPQDVDLALGQAQLRV